MQHLLAALGALFLLSSCANYPYSLDTPPEVKTDHVFHAVGYAPVENQRGETEDIKMLNAIKASKIGAYKEMAEQLHGVLLDANNSVNSAALHDDKIKAKVQGLVKGAKVLRSYHEGGLYITELELDMDTLPYVNSSAINNKANNKKRTLSPAVYY